MSCELHKPEGAIGHRADGGENGTKGTRASKARVGSGAGQECRRHWPRTPAEMLGHFDPRREWYAGTSHVRICPGRSYRESWGNPGTSGAPSCAPAPCRLRPAAIFHFVKWLCVESVSTLVLPMLSATSDTAAKALKRKRRSVTRTRRIGHLLKSSRVRPMPHIGLDPQSVIGSKE